MDLGEGIEIGEGGKGEEFLLMPIFFIYLLGFIFASTYSFQ